MGSPTRELALITAGLLPKHDSHQGPSTYLHAGASKQGWPADHTAEDTFELPTLTITPLYAWHEDKLAAPDPSEKEATAAFLDQWTTTVSEDPPYYYAEFGTKGGALLILGKSTTTTTIRQIASFETFADAHKAAGALNNQEGY